MLFSMCELNPSDYNIQRYIKKIHNRSTADSYIPMIIIVPIISLNLMVSGIDTC